MKRSWIIFCGFCVAMAVREAWPQAQPTLQLVETMDAGSSPESPPDSIALTVAPASDSSHARLPFEIDAGYHSPPVHPYFRDEYRLILDMRRLVTFVDRNAIIGMESLPELFEIGRNLPEQKQTEILRMAMVGGAANYLSEMVSKQLRKRKFGFVQWQLEKVVLRGAFQKLYASAFSGIRAKGFSAHHPGLRLSLSHQATKYYHLAHLNFTVSRHFGLSYAHVANSAAFGARYTSAAGLLALSYDLDLETLVSWYEIRRAMNYIIRVMHVNYLELPNADYMRAEVMLRW